MRPDQNLYQTVTPFGSVGFSMYGRGFSVSQIRQLSKCVSSDKMNFFAKISIFSKLITCLLNKAKTPESTPEPIGLFMASYQGFYAKFVSMMSPKCSIIEKDADFLPQQPIFSGVRTVFGFSRFGLSMRMPVSVIFFTR